MVGAAGKVIFQRRWRLKAGENGGRMGGGEDWEPGWQKSDDLSTKISVHALCGVGCRVGWLVSELRDSKSTPESELSAVANNARRDEGIVEFTPHRVLCG